VPIIADPIITLAQAKTFLNITGTQSDAELTDFIAAASQVIVNKIGPVSGSPTVSEWHDGGSSRIVLRHQGPLQSVTSVTETYGTVTYALTGITLDGAPVATAYGYTVDLDRGLIVRRASGVAIPFAAGTQNIHVTYVAGYSTIPADLIQATQLLLKHMWDTQRAAKGPGSGPGAGDSFTLPRRVEEILAYYTVPGIA
jgi:uncharacterized phiE125 gp8 family phage protein